MEGKPDESHHGSELDDNPTSPVVSEQDEKEVIETETSVPEVKYFETIKLLKIYRLKR